LYTIYRMMNAEIQIESNEVNNSPTEKRNRGRPKKIVNESIEKRNRGRPKKIVDEIIVKRCVGRPKITDESLRKTPLVRRSVLGRPKNNIELEDDLTLLQQRYKDRYYYIHQVYYTLKQHQDNIPNELKNLPQDTDEQVKTKACMLKQYVAHLEFQKQLMSINNFNYKPKPRKITARL